MPESKRENVENLVPPQAGPWKYKVNYYMVVGLTYVHVGALYGLFLCFVSSKWATLLFDYILLNVGILGITAGSHRLWTHLAYKAKLPLQVILIICYTFAAQFSATWWILVHRLHHKYSDTDGDPHNSSRGLFFTHVGWLLVDRHPEVVKRSKLIDMSDIHTNPVLNFQKKYISLLMPTIGFVLPTLIPMYFWGESLTSAWHLNLLRLALNYNIIFLVNSVGHSWGYRPIDRSIAPADYIPLVFVILGEGFHNFHHVFPWDYRGSELAISRLSVTTYFIDFFAWIGWAYDLKIVSEDVIRTRAKRTGDQSSLWSLDSGTDESYPEHKNVDQNSVSKDEINKYDCHSTNQAEML